MLAACHGEQAVADVCTAVLRKMRCKNAESAYFLSPVSEALHSAKFIEVMAANDAQT